MWSCGGSLEQFTLADSQQEDKGADEFLLKIPTAPSEPVLNYLSCDEAAQTGYRRWLCVFRLKQAVRCCQDLPTDCFHHQALINTPYTTYTAANSRQTQLETSW